MNVNTKIIIKETKQADTRNSESVPTKEVLLKESKDHIEAVSLCMSVLGRMLSNAGRMHDYTKIKYIDEFYDNFVAVMKDNKIEFKDLGWWKKHLEERHHLNDRAPDDVNLIDVIEMICDCVCAGLARSGEVRDINIPYEILDQAVRNTAIMLENAIEIKKE